jgi:hypothetical protein
MSYAKAIGLLKRFPTSAKAGTVATDGHPRVRGVFAGIFSALRVGKSLYIEALKGVDLKINRGRSSRSCSCHWATGVFRWGVNRAKQEGTLG